MVAEMPAIATGLGYLRSKDMGANAGYRLVILPLTSAIGAVAIAADVGSLSTMSAVAAVFLCHSLLSMLSLMSTRLARAYHSAT
jgi:hypothetical protein